LPKPERLNLLSSLPGEEQYIEYKKDIYDWNLRKVLLTKKSSKTTQNNKITK